MTPQGVKRWLAVVTQPNREIRAEFHLRQQGYVVYLPQYLKQVSHARRLLRVRRPLFPRYLFVNLAEWEAWRPVRSTVGVSGLVCAGENPIWVPAEVIAEVRAREDETGLVRLNSGHNFLAGEEIRVEFGSFAEFGGIFESRDDKERVTVLLNLLGRQVKAQLPLDAIRASA